MPDVNTQVAESSPATAVLEIPDVNSDAYAEWRATGELPEPPPPAKQKTEGSSPSKSEKTAPVSETGTHRQEPRERPRSNADDRLRELLADLKTAGLTPAELKSFKREAAKPELPKATPEQTVKPAEGELKYPDINDFKDLREFQAAEREYYKKLTAQEVKKALEEDRANRLQQENNRKAAAELKEAQQRYGESAGQLISDTAKTIWDNPDVVPVIKSLFFDSSVRPDVLYVIGSNPSQLQSFVEKCKTNPGEAIREFVVTEKLVKEELSHDTRQPSNDERPRKEAPVEKKPAEAPPPPRELGARTGPPGDEVSAATRANDFARYRDAANRRDVAARRGL